MKVSIIIPVLNSHEVVRRQILHFARMNLPDDVEVIIMDDGSDPPLESDSGVVTVHQTGETRPWTSSIARNRAAKFAKGRNFFMADVGYIIPKKAIMEAREFTGQKMQCVREFGVLDEDGAFTQDRDVLLAYGLLESRYNERGPRVPPHPNVFVMNRDIFWKLGGYNEKLVLSKPYPQGEDNRFRGAWSKWQKAGKGQVDTHRPMVYLFPRGQFCGDVDYNPHGLFHTLSRKTSHNIFWDRQKRREAKAK